MTLAVVPVIKDNDELLYDDMDFDVVQLHEEDGGFVLVPIDDPKKLKKLRKTFEDRIDNKLYNI